MPWTNLLDEDQTDNIVQFLQQLNLKKELCPESIDGDISLSYQNLFDKKKVSGYFQLHPPSFIKLIVFNPFGQPILALTSNQHTFQLINTFEKKYITGSVVSYGLLNNIPLTLLNGNWRNWIQGNIIIDPSTITSIRNDREVRGVWITIQSKTDDNLQKTHLLIEQKDGILLSQIVENEGGRLLAEISYGDWAEVGNCQQPRIIKVTGLEYGTEMTILLSDVRLAEELKKDDFQLTTPVGYLKQIIP